MKLLSAVRIMVLLAASLAALMVYPAAAQDEGDDVFVRVNGSVDFGPEEDVDVLVAVNSEAQIEGTVRKTLVVVNQNATVSGEVGEAVVYNGTLRLEPSARVTGDVTLLNSQLDQADGAEITGAVQERSGAEIGAEFTRATTLFSTVAWLGITVLFVVVALVWAAIGGQQLSGMAGLLGARPGISVVAALILWIVVPLLAIAALVTVIGIPLGIAILVVVLPVLWVLGYVVAGTRLGFFLSDLRGAAPNLTYPYLAAGFGVLILQLIGLVPFIGGIVVLLAGLIGAGALILYVWRRVALARQQASPPVFE